MDRRYIKISKAAKQTGLSRKMIYRAAAAGKITAFRNGNQRGGPFWLDAESFQKWVAARTIPGEC